MRAVGRLILASCLACATPPPPAPVAPPPSPELGAPVAEAPPSDPKTARVTLIAISDFHGWLLPLEPKSYPKYYGGIANIGGMLAAKEKLHPATSIIVDNGDMWTGPTESTFLRGEPVIAAYNELGVTAANVANHEFDYGLEILKTRAAEAKFPFLGANIRRAGSEETPSFLKPFVIVERDGIKVGIIGLSYRKTPETTLATHVAGLEFADYEPTLERLVPEVKAAGAAVVVVLFHDTAEEVAALLERRPGLGVHLVVAGQNHRKDAREVEGVPIVNPGPFGRSYARFDVEVDRETKAVRVRHEIVDVTGDVGAPPYPPSPKLAAIAEGARQRSQTLAGELLGRLEKPAPTGTFESSPIGHLVVDAWLAAFPDVDAAMCNHGALRQPLGQGPVSIADLTAVLPFENNLYIVRLTGKQLKAQLAIDHPVVGGLSYSFREARGAREIVSVVDRVGQPIQDARTYSVVINDFMYFGGDGFTFKEMDPTPEDTGLSLREPIIRAFRLAEQTGRALSPATAPRAARAK